MTTNKTPGFNTRLHICFTTDKNGRPVAYYISYPNMMRKIRMSYQDAKLFVETDQADEVRYVK